MKMRLSMLRHAVMLLIFVAFLTGCSKDDSKENIKIAAMVKYFEAGDKEQLSGRKYPGRVKANKEVELAFQVSGQLIEFPATEGSQVVEGELLGTLDPRDYKNDLAVEVAELNKSRLQYERTKELVEKGTISKADHDKTTAAFEVAKAKVSLSKKALEDTQLRAPFAGRVAKTYVDNFQNVKAEEPVLSLQDVSYVDVEFNVPEKDFLNAKENPDARTKPMNKVIIDALPNRQFPVVLKNFKTEAEEDTQTFQITVTMPAPEDVNVMPGMSATFVLLSDLGNDTQDYYVPLSCVQIDDKGNYFVWVIDESKLTVSRKQVKVGQISKENIQILEGISLGTKIVAAGIRQLQDNMKVRLWESKSKN
jgi:multidrug efflux system membrane fusion protein